MSASPVGPLGNTEQIFDLKDCKAPTSQKHLLKVIDHLSDDMNKFVMGLLDSLKGICLTRMSEKSITIMVKKYNIKLEEIRETWQHQINGDDFNNNLKNLISTLGICFEEILEKLSDLLTKLKNFNTAHFH